MGNRKEAGPEPIPHSEHREPGAEVLVPAGKSGEAGKVLTGRQPDSELAGTDSLPHRPQDLGL